MEKEGERLFSKIDQVGIVVRDIEKAMQYYSSFFGLGPFRRLNVTSVDRVVYGRPAKDVANLTRVTRMGSVQFELVQPISGESIQKEFLEKRGEGINHLGFFVKDLDAEVTKLAEKGFKPVSTGRFTGGGGFAYFDTNQVGGVFFEVIQWPPEEVPEK
jgi:methylmalonyl-CoA/ethylmalonyl-CoA epimerase